MADRQMLKVLIIDDSPTMASVCQSLLQKSGLECDVAHTAKAGLDRLEQALHQHVPYDGLLLDWILPDMDGADVLRQISNQKRFNSLSVMIFTESPDDLAYKLASERPNNDIQLKEDLTLLPFRMRKFLTTFKESSSIQSEMAVGRMLQDNRKPGGDILFVDDSPTVCSKYGDLLRNNGYTVHIANSMRQAIVLATEHVPQLAVVDYYMPDGNGDLLCKTLLSNPLTQDITVVMHSQAKDVIEEALNAGAIDLIWKDDPVNIFLMRIASIMRMLTAQRQAKQLDILQQATETLDVGVMVESAEGYESINVTMDMFAAGCGGLVNFIPDDDEEMPKRIVDNQQINRAFNIHKISAGQGGIVLVQDITQLADQAEALARARDQAVELARTKSEFLANMSHEIRTPMNAILGLCYLLQQQNLEGSAAGYVNKIHLSGKALLGIINDILDFSKIDANKLVIEHIPFDMEDILSNLSTVLSTAQGDKDIEIMIDPIPDGCEYLTGDSLRLGQVLINLAGNAIKFTQKGQVAVRLTRVENPQAKKDQVFIRFDIVDTGIGIDEEKLKTIFSAFSQADTSTTRSFGGSGLGLTISNRLVGLMGGELTVTSETNKGSCFSFTLGFQTCETSPKALREKARIHVLVVDDNEKAREVIASNAASIGWNVQTASTAEDALAYFEAGHACNLLILDSCLSSTDSLETVGKVRSYDAFKNLPVILLASNQQQEALAGISDESLIDAVLAKPVTQSSLFDALQTARKSRGLLELKAVGELTEDTRLAGLHILVVDDSEINRVVARQILVGEGASISLANDGKDALRQIAESEQTIDLVLMDIQMPVMDGYQATQQIRQDEVTKNLPVIALSAGVLQQQRDSAMKAGMDAFVPKPFDVEDLINKILLLTSQTQDDRQPDLLWSAPVTAKTNTQTLDDKPDFSTGLKIWQDEPRFKLYLQKFAEEWPVQLSEIDSLDAEQKSRLIHKLKGASGSLGLKALTVLCARFEEQSQGGNKTKDIIDMIHKSMSVAIDAIHEYSPETEGSDEDTALDPDNLVEIGATLNAALLAANDDNFDELEADFKRLDRLMPHKMLKPLESAIQNFDIKEAQDAIRGLSEKLGIDAEITA